MTEITISKKNAILSGFGFLSLLFLIIASIENKAVYYVLFVLCLLGILITFFKDTILSKVKTKENIPKNIPKTNEDPINNKETKPTIVQLQEVSVKA